MYGPNYVKLSSVFAAQLFNVFIVHYTALPLVRSGPHWHQSHAITASIRFALAQALTAAPSARDPDLDSGNHDMSRLSSFAWPNDAPIHGLAGIPLRRLPTDIGCGALAPPDSQISQNSNTQRNEDSSRRTLERA
jgi:hypothetical protein